MNTTEMILLFMALIGLWRVSQKTPYQCKGCGKWADETEMVERVEYKEEFYEHAFDFGMMLQKYRVMSCPHCKQSKKKE